MANKLGIGSHTKPRTGEHEIWLTPPGVLLNLGEFDLDPCAAPSPRPWPTARHHIEPPEDGLKAGWHGRVWLNPPYGEKTYLWLERMARYRNGLALVFARTETQTWMRFIWPVAHSVLFIEGRLVFYLPDGTRPRYTSGAPSALISFSEEETDVLRKSGIAGALVRVIH